MTSKPNRKFAIDYAKTREEFINIMRQRAAQYRIATEQNKNKQRFDGDMR